MKHVAFFGDSKRVFALPIPLIEQLQRKTGHGIGAIFRRMQSQEFSIQEVAEVIRFGLIGGGTDPLEADTLVKTYVEEWPLVDNVELAQNILFVRFFGDDLSDDEDLSDDDPQDEDNQPVSVRDAAELRADIARAFESDVQEAAATGNLGAALNEAGHG